MKLIYLWMATVDGVPVAARPIFFPVTDEPLRCRCTAAPKQPSQTQEMLHISTNLEIWHFVLQVN